MLHESDLPLRRSGAECDGLGAQYFWKLPGQHGGLFVASFTVLKNGNRTELSLSTMSGSKRLPCQKEACAIQKCLQGMISVDLQ